MELQLQTQDELENSLEKLENCFEEKQQQPLFYKDLPKQLLAEHLPLITGFWAKPIQVKAIAKHHQGSKTIDVKRVIHHLLENGNYRLAEEIKKENFKNK